jgi:ferredoxin
MNRRQLTTLAALVAAALTGFASATHAQAENKPLRILVGFPPGGSIDIVARLLADKLKDELKTTVIVENKAGAGGRIAAELLKSALADGSNFMITPVVVPVLAPLVFSKLNYNAATDFAPVGHVCNFGFAVTVPAALPVKNVSELVAWLKANPQKANFGSPAAGSLPHSFGEMLSRDAKAELVHVPFAGAPQPQHHLYACGPNGFMDFVTAAARRLHWPAGQVHLERFGAEVNTDGAPFTVVAARSQVSFDVHPGQRIADQLLASGISVRMSCQSGVCGTCITPVLEGLPDHRDHVQTDSEKAANRSIAVCCSRSRTRQLVPDI